MNPKTRTLCVVGPTASGKTALAVKLAKALNGEVISCDSMQIYDRLSIGTAKPTTEEMEGIPHHLIGFADPRVPFSCADYVPLAKAVIDDITARGKLPVFCGGTGLYLDSVLSGTEFSAAPADTAVGDELRAEFARNGIDGIYAHLQELDPASAEAIHKNNAKRIIRALEIVLTTGKPKSVWDAESHNIPSPYHATVIGLDYKDRSVLHERINRRVTLMLEAGLVDEVRTLYEGGWLPEGSTAAQAIGYKEFSAYLRGEMTEAEAAEQIRTSTRRYAKRQLTWFRRNPAVHWLYPDTITPTAGKTTADILAEEAVRIFENDNP
ncbi:MAG: tRNA (adenosine(37)-N6)-dimethylallyltransferase MiaA [Clostridia bacterium]|nr:tRNA (adenosine(37)-N6)-dimethylallyltransferase MiaA [Clostridia bacterium]